MTDYTNVKKITGITDKSILLDLADIEEALRLGIASVECTIPEKGVLARMKSDIVFLLSAADLESSILLMDKLPKDEPYVLCIHGTEAIGYAKEKCGLTGNTLYFQYVYEGSAEEISKHMVCLEGCDLEVRHPGEESFAQVVQNYDLIPEYDLRKDFEDPSFLGGFTEGEFACFIGLHREGAMGLLRVFPQFRRRGYAEKIYSTLIYNQLKRGAIPYCHVDVTNDASIHIQNKLGFTKAQKTVAWLSHDI